MAGTYWVSPTGVAAWTACQGTMPLNGTAACPYTTANANANAGDTVYYRGGTYTITGLGNYGIDPANSGTSSAKITFSAYTGESPVLTQGAVNVGGMRIRGKNWIVVNGFTFLNLYYDNFVGSGGSYNEISNNQFVNTTTAAEQAGPRLFELGLNGSAPFSVHNWFHNNYLSNRASSNPCGEGIDLLRIGMAQGAPNYSEDNYNTVENNYLEHSGHANIVTYGRFNVIRNNIGHNEPWITGCTSYSGGPDAVVPFTAGTTSTSTLNLVTGSQTATVATGLDTSHWKSGAFFTMSELDANGLPLNFGMGFGTGHGGPYGSITSYNSTTGALTFNVVASTDVLGSGSFSKWAFYLYNIPAYTNAAYNGLFSHRLVAIGDNTNPEPNYNLIEGNRFGHAGVNPHNGGADNLDLESSYNIVRYNYVYNGMGAGISIKTTTGFSTQNYIYNNTSYHNGFGHNWDVFQGSGVTVVKGGLIQFYQAGANHIYNIWKNNLSYGNDRYVNGPGDICQLNSDYLGSNCTPTATDIMAGNWITTNGDPQFLDPTLCDPNSQNLIPTAHGYTFIPTPDLRIPSTSPVIDRGTWMAIANGAGTSSTTLVVKSATGSVNELCPSCYFQDGSWGSDLTRTAGTMHADWIAIGTVTSTVQIQSINYATNTITLSSPVTWNDGASIWLYKKSDGSVVLSGTAPDVGASEFTN